MGGKIVFCGDNIGKIPVELTSGVVVLSIALPVQKDGKLGPHRLGERPIVLKRPQTGEYVMHMHMDNMGHTDQFVGHAISKTVRSKSIGCLVVSIFS